MAVGHEGPEENLWEASKKEVCFGPNDFDIKKYQNCLMLLD